MGAALSTFEHLCFLAGVSVVGGGEAARRMAVIIRTAGAAAMGAATRAATSTGAAAGTGASAATLTTAGANFCEIKCLKLKPKVLVKGQLGR